MWAAQAASCLIVPIFLMGSVIMVVLDYQLSDSVAMLRAGALMGLFVNGMMGEGSVLQSPSQTSFRVAELDEMSARREVMR